MGRPFMAGVCLLLVCITLPLTAQDDAHLYYRRTHGGAWPPNAEAMHHDAEGASIALSPQNFSASAALLDSGVDPSNLGKGDWIWQISSCLTALNVPNVQGLMDYEKSRGMRWITVKCGDGGSVWAQFNSDLITRAHNAGLKIFGWAYVYGNNVQGEINVALNALNLGADGFIIDAESEYETLANNSVAASNYCSAIKAAYPTRFLAHAPFPIISSHSGFPYVMFGRFCDAVMPQAYWADIGGTNYTITMVTRMNSEWRNWQNSLTGANTNAIKPIIPIGQGYNSVNGTVTSSQISSFINALKTNTPSATSGGYKGVSFWSCQHHSADIWNAIGAIQIGVDAPVVLTEPKNRSVNTGTNVTFAVTASGLAPLRYQWRFNGSPVMGATNSFITRSNVQINVAGRYDVVVTNTVGAVTSAVARLTVNTALVWQVVFNDGFETNSSSRWSLFQGSANGVPDYTATWAFDYSTQKFVANGVTNFIPPPPSGTGTRGLKLTVNKNDASAALSGISLYPKSQSFSGDHTLRCDVWLSYNGPVGGSAGSTEFATFGLNHAGTRVNWGGGSASASDGVWFAVDGEGGTTLDYRSYEGTNAGGAVLLDFGSSGLDANGAASGDSEDPFFQSLFLSPAYESSGAPGKRWLQCEVRQLGRVVTWLLNGVVVSQRTNTSAFTNGTAMIGYMDLFSSIPAELGETFVIFDNVQVLVPVLGPAITAQPTNLIVNVGATARFAVNASGTAPQFQWRFNNAALANATNGTLLLTNAALSHAGSYSVVVSNAAGVVLSSNAVLEVRTLRVTSLTPSSNGWSLAITGAPGAGYVVEGSTNLVTWAPLAPFTNNGQAVIVPSTNLAAKFFRVSAAAD